MSAHATGPQTGETHRRPTTTLTVTSLLSMLLATIHLADDIVFKLSPGGLSNFIAVGFVVVGLYGTLVLAECRVGYVIVLLTSLLLLGVTIIHMRGGGIVGPRIGASDRAFIFVWTLLALATTSTFSIVLSLRALWSLPWRRARVPN
jgi:hypothetical protein